MRQRKRRRAIAEGVRGRDNRPCAAEKLLHLTGLFGWNGFGRVGCSVQTDAWGDRRPRRQSRHGLSTASQAMPKTCVLRSAPQAVPWRTELLWAVAERLFLGRAGLRNRRLL